MGYEAIMGSKELTYVAFNGPDGNDFFVKNDETRIILRCDGVGPMGFYNMIYVTRINEGVVHALPAHNCNEWRTKP